MCQHEPVSTGVRARNRAALEAAIREVATDHLRTHGAAALSLRAVARDVGIASSAIYRYVASRDDLLTVLIVDAYTSLGDAVDEALERHARARPATRFRTVARTMRAWALDHPHQYALIYGSPVPDYHAPTEVTTPVGTRVQGRLVEILADLDPAVPRSARAARALRPMLEDPMFAGLTVSAAVLERGLASWHLVLGTISSEVFGQLGEGSVADPDALFEGTVELALGLIEADARG